MNRNDDEATGGSDPIEAILKDAAPRPAPPAAFEHAVRDAVGAEWRAVVADRRTRARRWQFAAAASILVAAVLLLTTMPLGTVAPMRVASIDKSNGTIYLLAERSELVALPDVTAILSGQVIQTGDDGALGLDWGGGGSLRVDGNTRIEFVDDATVFLHRGRIYFGSDPGLAPSSLIVETRHASVTHLGTQYMAEADANELVVSVREGRVHITGNYHEQLAEAGKQVRLRGPGRPVVADVPVHGEPWTWTEALAPGLDLDNRSAFDFLEWVGRETGHEIVFDSTAAKQLAIDTMLVGTVEAEPRTELRLRMLTTDLEYTFNTGDGKIHIRMAEDGED